MGKEIAVESIFLSKMVDELGWRSKELLVLRSQIPIENNAKQKVMLRAAIPFLYAHWEGFVKTAMSYYLEHISYKQLNHNQLTTNFVALSLTNTIKDVLNNSFETKTKIIDLLFKEYTKRSNIPKKNIINTKSNLNFDVLKEIIGILDLNDPFIDKQEVLINDLVTTRNTIAHGNVKDVDYTTFESFFTEIVALMEYLKTKIENNVVLKSYSIVKPILVEAL
jgi:predicted transcriptional regulator